MVEHGSGRVERIVLNRLRTTIGRSARCDISIPDAFASRVHAELRLDGSVLWLADLGSANGIRLNGETLTAPRQLAGGDRFVIGETVFEVSKPETLREAGSAVVTEETGALDPSTTISLNAGGGTSELMAEGAASRQGLLGLISKVGVTLLSSGGLEDTLNQVVALVFEAVPADRCAIVIGEGDSVSKVQTVVARRRGGGCDAEEIVISRSVRDEVLVHGRSVLTSDAQHDPRFAGGTMALLGVRSVLAVPLSVGGGGVFGLVYADSPTEMTVFTEEHLNVLTTLASVAGIRVEKARLQEEHVEKERYARELALASEIQQRFLPAHAPTVPGFELQGISFSCHEIGGDYYDFIARAEGGMMVLLGDVSGKGTAAALLMSSLHAAVHAQVAAGLDLRSIPERLNAYLLGNTPSNRFITLFMSELDETTGHLRFVNAGHNPPMICRADGQLIELKDGGLPLGLMSSADYQVGSEVLNPGDSLVIYSDGLTEAVGPDGDEFGTLRLAEVLREGVGDSAARLRDRIESALSAFTATAPASDDITMVIVKRMA